MILIDFIVLLAIGITCFVVGFEKGRNNYIKKIAKQIDVEKLNEKNTAN